VNNNRWGLFEKNEGKIKKIYRLVLNYNIRYLEINNNNCEWLRTHNRTYNKSIYQIYKLHKSKIHNKNTVLLT
jgi:hypothetical protein